MCAHRPAHRTQTPVGWSPCRVSARWKIHTNCRLRSGVTQPSCVKRITKRKDGVTRLDDKACYTQKTWLPSPDYVSYMSKFISA